MDSAELRSFAEDRDIIVIDGKLGVLAASAF